MHSPNIKLKISSASLYGKTCVGVAKLKDGIIVANTNKPQQIVHFTPEEWNAFIVGVKKGEFDSNNLES